VNTQIIEQGSVAGTDLQVLIARLTARRSWLITGVLVSTAVFIFAAFFMTPIYRSETVLISASEERNSMSSSLNSALGQLGGLASLAGITLGSSDNATEEALAVLRSRQFTERFIGDLNLRPELFADKWDAQRGEWKVQAQRQPTPARAFKRFAKLRTIKQDNKTGLVTLQIDWKDRLKAAQWANELARRLNAEMRARAIENAEAALKFLERELESTTVVETRQAINRLIEAQVRQRMIANVTQEYAFRVVDPALPSDKDDPVRPQKLLLLALGPLVGLVLGVLAVLAAAWIADARNTVARG
jgi:uncharacterized protein involved in exopolysaccharide biosynthesis